MGYIEHVNPGTSPGARGCQPIKYKSRSYFENCCPDRRAAQAAVLPGPIIVEPPAVAMYRVFKQLNTSCALQTNKLVH